MNNEVVTVLLCGVGGQGTILAADLLARVAIAEGLDVKVSEIHGMSQRGGAVTTVVRFGKKVTSMVASKGSADYVVSSEKMEALRNAVFVKKDGLIIASNEVIKPQSVLAGRAAMPSRMDETLNDLGALVVPADRLAREAGTAKAANVVLLGALSQKLDFAADTWKSCIEKRVPGKYLEENLAAFEAGRSFSN